MTRRPLTFAILLGSLLTLGPAFAAGSGGARGGGKALVSPFPTAERYVEAMHNPTHYVKDPLLKKARVELDARSRPLTYFGRFGTVFQLRTKSGRAIALRVFHPLAETTERLDLDKVDHRYGAMAGYLSGLRAKKLLPTELLDLEYVPAALEIDGRELPATKMPWIEGVTLADYFALKVKARQPRALTQMARNFRAAMVDLAHVEVAMGDLHHENILVQPDGTMRFVDYDGMYAPPLDGLENSEIGNPNFQHPKFFFPRPNQRPFNAKMDRFSSIVTYLSMTAVAADPSLWSTFNNDHTLIFEGARDFKDPKKSPVFKQLLRSTNPRVRGLAAELMRYAQGDPEDVPDLEEALRRAGAAEGFDPSEDD